MLPVRKVGRKLLRSNSPMHRAKKKRAFVISPNPPQHCRNLGANLADSQNAISTKGGKEDFRDAPFTGNGMFPIPSRPINAPTPSRLDESRIIAKNPALIAALMYLEFLRLVA